MDLDGRSALVTGGAGGLGAATVRRLVEVGVGVAIFDRDADRAAALAKELGDAVVSVGGDVNDDDDVAAAIDGARSLGTFSLVVNVAGGGVGGGRTVARDGTPHDKGAFIGTMEMNAFGTFNVTRLAAAAMADNEPDEHGQRGVVVNTSSIAGIEGQTGQLAYAAAKAAILGMTLPLARDLAAVGIRVLRDRARHDGHAHHAQRARRAAAEPRQEHRLPQAHGSARGVRPARRVDRAQPLPQRREHPAGRRAALPTEVDPERGHVGGGTLRGATVSDGTESVAPSLSNESTIATSRSTSNSAPVM